MKKLALLLSLVISLTSCGGVYKFYQVYQVQPVDIICSVTPGGDMVYENQDCRISYNFWSENGAVEFYIYNKTDEILYVDLTKSFFVRNGHAYDYFLNRQWSSSSSISAGSSSATSVTMPFLRNVAVSSADATIAQSSKAYAYVEKPILAIPAHAYKIVNEYSITDVRFFDCDLDKTPNESAAIFYQQDESPLSFGNVISYSVGENGALATIENMFYVSSITNYAEPAFYTFTENKNPCITAPSKSLTTTTTYSRYSVPAASNRFYIPYKVSSSKQLYKTTQNYYWNESLKAWVKGSSSGTTSGTGFF